MGNVCNPALKKKTDFQKLRGGNHILNIEVMSHVHVPAFDQGPSDTSKYVADITFSVQVHALWLLSQSCQHSFSLSRPGNFHLGSLGKFLVEEGSEP